VSKYDVSARGVPFSFVVEAVTPDHARLRGALILVSMHWMDAIQRIEVRPRVEPITPWHLGNTDWLDRVEAMLVQFVPRCIESIDA
jgi:hypothetical protein